MAERRAHDDPAIIPAASWWYTTRIPGIGWVAPALTPSADLPACRDEDPATPAALAAAYPDPPEYQHPEEPVERESTKWTGGDDG